MRGLSAMAVGLLGGCEEGPGTSPDEPTATHALNPPSWIHGSWGDCTPVPGFETSWTFSVHNIVFRSGATSIDYRETAKTSGVTVREDSGDGWYRFEMESPDGQGGTLRTSNRFARDDARLRWTNTYGGISTTVTICRHG